MSKIYLDFYVTSVTAMMPIIFAGMLRYNLNKIQNNQKETRLILIASLVFSIIPFLNIVIGAMNFEYLISGRQ